MAGIHIRTKLMLFATLLLISFLASFLSGCNQITETADSHPFIVNRVITVRISMPPENWHKCMNDPYAQEYVKADFEYDGRNIGAVGVRPKGNSSLNQAVVWNSPRMPLAVDFNLFNRARSLYGVKKVFLNNGWSDPTLIRERLAYDIFAEMDLPTPRSCLVDLWVNQIHLGVYTMAEMVDAAFLKRHFPDPTGNLYKPDVLSALLDWTEDDLAPQRIKRARFQTPEPNAELNVNLGGGRLLDILRAMGEEESVAGYVRATPIPKEAGLPMTNYRDYIHAMNLKTNLDKPDYSALFKFLKVLNKEPAETFIQEIEKVLDIDSTLRFFAVSGVILHLDNYNSIGHNAHFYEVDGKFHIIPWDTNMAFGTFNSGIRKEGLIHFYVDEPVAGPMNRYPLINRLLAHPPYLEKYRQYVKQLVDGPFSPEVMETKIDQLSRLVAPYAAADPHYFYAPGDWARCLNEDLRPPDAFEGWMAGGMSPMLPWISGTESSKVFQSFGARDLWSLLGRNWTAPDLAILRTCLSDTSYKLFLQNKFGPLETPQPPGQPGFGPNSLGLKPLIMERIQSVREQLRGERKSKSGYGAGNGGSMWIADFIKMF